MQQIYETVSIRDAWWNVVCQGCGLEIADKPWRTCRITWGEILQIAFDLWGAPGGFAVRDFLITMQFCNGQILLTFCSQGPRRGEVDISVAMGDQVSHNRLAEFMNCVRAKVENVDHYLLDHFEEDMEEWDGRAIL